MRHRATHRFLTAALGLLGMACLTTVALACPNCGDQLSEYGRGFFWSILLMMGAPFGVTAAAVTGIVVTTKRTQRRALEQEGVEAPSGSDSAAE